MLRPPSKSNTVGETVGHSKIGILTGMSLCSLIPQQIPSLHMLKTRAAVAPQSVRYIGNILRMYE